VDDTGRELVPDDLVADEDVFLVPGDEDGGIHRPA
jgi:hypothetical protein